MLLEQVYDFSNTSELIFVDVQNSTMAAPQRHPARRNLCP